MAINALSPQIRSFSYAPQAQAAEPNKDNSAAAETYTRKPIDEHNFSWGDAGKGLVGAVANAAMYGVGAGADTLVRTPQLFYEAEKGLIKTPMLGPVIKFTTAPLLLVAAAAAPALALIGGTGYGLYKGFVDAAENGVGESVKHAYQDLKKLHGTISKNVIQSIRDLSTQPLADGQKPFDISIVGGAKGLVGAAAGTVIDGVGIGTVTLAEAPRAFYKVNKAIWKSDAALPLKTIGSVLTLPATPIAVGLGFVGGGLVGLGYGAKNAYTDGLGKSISDSGKLVHDYTKAVNEGLKHMD